MTNQQQAHPVPPFFTEEAATGFVEWADRLDDARAIAIAERDTARAERDSWEAQCLLARREVAELRAELAALHAEGRRTMLPADFDAQYDGRGSQ